MRHYWKLLATCVAFVAVLGLVFSTTSIHPYVLSASDENADQVTDDIAGTKDLFDSSISHSISITFTRSAYDDMLDDYFKDGEKDFLEADITIDGTTIESVGIRLKGNSTLSGLTRNGQTASRGGFGGEDREGRGAGRLTSPPASCPPARLRAARLRAARLRGASSRVASSRVGRCRGASADGRR
ncbi:hypothetical protein [Cryptosporangium japonicum]|uniref:hypothetical protein n=1 Tax=Cryptosporangium japonicum TaxID=80872 RepID=UPI0031D8422E